MQQALCSLLHKFLQILQPDCVLLVILAPHVLEQGVVERGIDASGRKVLPESLLQCFIQIPVQTIEQTLEQYDC